MKIILAVAAALVAATAVPAVAAPAAGQDRVVVHERTVVRHERHWGRDHRRTVCDRRWRNGHRVRVCRTVRY